MVVIAAMIVASAVLTQTGPAAAETPPSPTSSSVNSPHPRVMASPGRFSSLASQAGTDSYSNILQSRIVQDANQMLSAPLVTFDRSDAGSMLASARTLSVRSATLSMAWRLSNDRGYLDRLASDIAVATGLNDWYPDHFLVTAEMTQAISIAYDWGYSAWTDGQRGAMRAAIIDKGLAPSLQVYASTTSVSPFRYLGNWSLRADNINVVVNSAMIIGAAAVSGDSTASTIDSVLSKAVPSLRLGLGAYASDGSFPEGPTYWEYATRFVSSAITTLRGSTGSDYGLATQGGFARTADYIRALTGPYGVVYGYADSARDIQIGGALSGLGAAQQNPSLTALAATSDSTGFAPQQLLWRDLATLSGVNVPRAPLDASLGGSIATGRGGLQTDSSFFAFKYSGTPSASHQQYDVGDFNFQALGQEWATDLGLEQASYLLTEGSVAPRWQYYRVNPEGHNTLSTQPMVASPPSGTVGTLLSSWSSVDSTTTIADLTDASSSLYSWRRGVQLFNGRTELLVQDEFSAASRTDVLWSMHTAANISVASDGRSALLWMGGQRLLARLLPASAGSFTTMSATPQPTSPQPAQEANTDVRKLAVATTVQGSATIAVQLTPLTLGSSAAAPPALRASTALNTWSAPAGTACTLSSLSVGGIPAEGFSSDVASYSVPQPLGATPPTVSAAASSGSVSVSQATPDSRSAVVTVSGSNCTTTAYRVLFPRSDLAISSSTATATSAGSPTFTFDGKPTSSWSAPASGATITWQFSNPVSPSALVVQWGAVPSVGSYAFEWSTDGRSWQSLTPGLKKTSAYVQIFATGGVSGARFLRLSSSAAIEVREFEAFTRVPTDDWFTFPTTTLLGVSLSGVPTKMELGSGASASVTFSATGPAPADVSVRFVTRGTGALSVSNTGDIRANEVGDDVVGVIASWGGVTVSAQVVVSVVDSTRVRIYATADGWAQSSTPTVGYGSAGGSTIKAPWLGSPDRVAYATFDLSSLAGKTVTSAVMSAVMVISEARDGQDISRVDAHATTGSYTEAGLTYQNRPTLTDTVGSFVIDRTKKIVTSDLTTAIAQTAAGTPGAYTLGFTQDDAGATAIAVTLTTREGGTAPYIDITLAPAPAAAVPAPVMKSIAVTGIDQVEKGSTATATTAVTDSLGRALTGANVTYTSQNTGVATVTSAGKVTGVSTGTTRVTATATAGQITVSAQVVVSVVDSTRVRIYATADGWAQSSTPTVGYGSAGGSTIKAPWLGSPDRVAYATFDLSSLAGKTVTSAVMSAVMVISEARDGQDISRVDAHATTGSYTEAGLTYQNRPTLTDTVGSFVVDRTKKIVTSDLTTAIAQAAAGTPGAYTLGFTQDDAGATAIAVTLTTREGGTAPYIDITLAPAPAAAVPAPVMKSIAVTGIDQVEKGSTATATTAVTDSLGRALTGANVTYTSQNTGIATVTSAGKVTGVSTGTTRVTATATAGQVTVSTQVVVSVVDSTRVRIYATADGWAQSSTPTVGYGSQGGSTIKAPWLGSPDRVAYATFDLSSLAGKTVTSAVMSAEMVISEARDGQDISRVDAHATTGSYTEAGLTYQNRPPLTDTVGSFVVDRTKKIVTSDLTTAIAQTAAGTPGAYTLGFTQDDAGATAIAVTLTTREGGTAPYIDITLAP